MESEPVADLLRAAHKEQERLEALLCSNPDFQKLEGVRRIIQLYEQEPGYSACPTPVPAERQETISRPIPGANRPTNTSRLATHSDPQKSIAPRRWKWGHSQTSQIQAAAAEHLRRTGKRATGGEICKAIMEAGVEISGNSTMRAALVCARLSRAPAIFDHTAEGYGLREWSDGNAGRR